MSVANIHTAAACVCHTLLLPAYTHCTDNHTTSTLKHVVVRMQLPTSSRSDCGLLDQATQMLLMLHSYAVHAFTIQHQCPPPRGMFKSAPVATPNPSIPCTLRACMSPSFNFPVRWPDFDADGESHFYRVFSLGCELTDGHRGTSRGSRVGLWGV